MQPTPKSGLWLLVSIFLFLNGCAKHSGEPGSSQSSSGRDPGTTPGITTVSTYFVRLHVNGHAQLGASVYDSSGKLVSPQPVLSWTSGNSPAINVSSTGQITALAQGSAEVTVSDGAHGSAVVKVSVVPDSVVISSAPASISWSPFWTSLAINSRAAIPPYTVIDSGGNVVNVTPTFEIQRLSGASVVGSSIVSGGTAGVGTLVAKVNGQYLAGAMPVWVYDAGKPAGNQDSTLQIWLADRFPVSFNYYGQSVNVNDITLYMISSLNIPGGGFYVNFYNARPTGISVQYPDLIDVNGGTMTSKAPGTTVVTIHYKYASYTTTSTVGPDLMGSWGAKIGGTSYNFCFSKEGSSSDPAEPVRYGRAYFVKDTTGGWSGILGWLFNGTAYVGDGVHPSPVKSSMADVRGELHPGPLYKEKDVIGQLFAGPVGVTYNLAWTGDVNKLTLQLGPTPIGTLVRGAGNCAAPTPPAMTLAQLLESRPWHGSVCLDTNLLGPDRLTYAFDSTGHGSVSSSASTVPNTWSVDQNNVITIADNIDATVKFFVNTYDSTGIVLSKATIYSKSQNVTDTYTPASTGCILSLNP